MSLVALLFLAINELSCFPCLPALKNLLMNLLSFLSVSELWTSLRDSESSLRKVELGNLGGGAQA